MSKLQWDLDGQKKYEAGVRNCAIYVKSTQASYKSGVAWNGITAVSENPSGAEESKLYADDATYAIMYSPEEYGFSIEAYTYPDEFAECNGEATAEGGHYAMQKRSRFGLVYETRQGDDTSGILEDGKRVLHIVFNAYAKPTSANYSTINDSPDAITFSWECDTLPVVIEKPYGVEDEVWAEILEKLGGLPEPVSNMDIVETEVSQNAYDTIRNMFYGTDAVGETPATDPKMLTPGEIICLLNEQ